MGAELCRPGLLVVVVGGENAGRRRRCGGRRPANCSSSIFAYFTNDTFVRFVLFVLIVVFLRIRPEGLFAPSATRR